MLTGVTRCLRSKRISPAAAWYLHLCVFDFCAHRAQKSNTREDRTPRKIYQLVPDEVASRQHLVRVIDESGEAYLYPDAYFLPVDLPQAIKDALLRAA